MPPSEKKIRLFLLDDHAVFRQALGEIVRQEKDLEVAAEAGSVREAIPLLARTKPDILLLDLRLPGLHGLELISRMKDLSPETRILVFTSSAEERDVVDAMRLGAHGILLKNSPAAMVLKGIRRVADNQIWLDSRQLEFVLNAFRSSAGRGPAGAQLSRREKEIIELVISGCKNKEIGRKLAISEKTVKNHLSNIFSKLGVSGRLELVLYSFEKRSLGE